MVMHFCGECVMFGRRYRETMVTTSAGGYTLTLSPSGVFESYLPNGVYNFTINATALGGTAPYTYLWSNVTGIDRISTTLPLSTQNMSFTCSGTNARRAAQYICTSTDSLGIERSVNIHMFVGFNVDATPPY